MKNKKVAEILYNIADILELQEVEFKPRAYRNAARSIENLSKDIEDVMEEGKLEDIPGVGKSIADKIEEYLKTGKLKYYKKLKNKVPVDLDELLKVEGVGTKSAKLFYKKLNVKNLKDLEKAAKNKKIRKLGGMGQKTEKDILHGIELVKKSKGRMLLGRMVSVAKDLKSQLKKMKHVDNLEIAGSFRRKKETIGDLDILITTTKPKKIMQKFAGLNNVEEIISKGSTRGSVRLEEGLQVDLRVIRKKSFGSALMYFTGSKSHNIGLRKIAQKKNWKLNEYGLFKGKKFIAGKTEKEIYKKLKMQYIPPELRENRGEIEIAQKRKIPKLIKQRNIKGDLQMHSTYSDGKHTIKEMADAAKQLGHDYIAMTDHVGALRIAHAMKKKTIKRQWKKISRLNKGSKFKIFKGAEIDIKGDGTLNVPKGVVKDLDIVLGSVHHKFKMKEREMTNRLCKAIKTGKLNMIAHPTTRMIGKREPINADWEKIFQCAKDNDVALEINSYPNRLDLPDTYAKMAKEMGCKLSINTDAHNKNHLRYMKLGVFTARRGWLEKKDVINTKTKKQLEKFLNK